MGELIDSSILITWERRGGDLSSLATERLREPVAVAAITVSELLVGLHLADTAERRLRRQAFIEGVLDLAPVLAFDLNVATVHAGVWARMKAAGQLIGAHDLLIAATALAHGYSVLTANLREFQQVPGLSVRLPDS